ncbi:MAG TPA: RodZ domain-containing protein [Candidatus Polarisedimenticolia bacterium]|jgi:cytoskeletal protein RodZ|nr:RodZ domain-containing protein [Candidatus Polarisedimenticolia bacterium]
MATFGETLKRERELRKISLREVCEATKIGLRYLEALEGNRFDQLPGGVFNKGFIRAYAKFIGLDAEALITSYLFDLGVQQNPQPIRPRYVGADIEAVPEIPAAKPAPAAPRRRQVSPRHWAWAGSLAAISLAAAGGVWLIAFRGPSIETRPAGSLPKRSAKAQVGGDPISSPASAENKETLPFDAAAQPPVLANPEPAPRPETPDSAAAAPGAPASRETAWRVADLGLSLSVSEPTWVALACDGTERLNREIAAGDTVRLTCRKEIRLSSADAGAITMRINGNDCLPLGERGAALDNFLFDRERAAELCPPNTPER